MQPARNASMWLFALCGLQLVIFAQGMNPLEKTVELLTSLQGQVVADGERGQSAYDEYAHWCKQASAEKTWEVKGFTKQKAKLEADIQLASGDIVASTSKIEELVKEVSTGEQKKEDLMDARAEEQSTFEEAETELVQTIDMLGRAIGVLEKEMQGPKAALVQTAVDTDGLEDVLLSLGTIIDAAGIPAGETQKLAALLQARQDSRDGDASDALSAPSSEAYETHSDSIVEVMEDMRDKAEEQLRLLREGEAKAQANYALVVQSLKKQIENFEKDMKDEKSDKAASEEAKATAEGDLSVTEQELAATQAALKNTQGSCLRAAADHETSIQGRKEELTVLAKAKKTIQASMLQQSTSLVQLSSRSTAKAQKHAHGSLQVLAMVRRLSAQQNSTALGQLASRLATVIRFGVSSGKDPLAKVKQLIVDMIGRLEGDISSDAKEKAYCDDELRRAGEQRDELKDKMGGLGGRTDRSQAKSATLKSEVEDLQQELAALAREQAELDRVRTVAHKDFDQTKADLQKSLDGTRTAIRMLRDYYANDDENGGSAALVQDEDSFSAEMKEPSPPRRFQKASGAGASIIGILEVSESDLAKNIAEEETEEAGRQAEYEKLSEQSKVLRVQKEKDVAYKTSEYTAIDKSITDLASDYDTETEELEAVEEYLAKVKERCVARPESYETQKERREAEIKGLREALGILQSDGQMTLLQRGRQREPMTVHF